MGTETRHAKLTAAAARTALPGDLSELTLADSDLPGFRLRIGKRSKRWVMSGRVRGGPRRTVVLGDADSMTAAEARRRAQEVRSAMLSGVDPQPEPVAEAPKPEPATFAEMAQRYQKLWAAGRLRRQTKRPTVDSIRGHQRDLIRAEARFGSMAVADIDLAAVRRWIGDLEDEDVSGSTKRRAVGAASRILAHAAERGQIKTNPFKLVSNFSQGPARDRVLDHDEVRAVWAGAEALGRRNRDFVRFLLAQPLRVSMATGLSWGMVDLDNQTLDLPAGMRGNKSRTPWRLPLSPLAARILEETPDGRQGPVFRGLRGGALTWSHHQTARLREASGIPDFTLHDFRRTAVSLSAERFEAFDEDLADRWLCHKRTGIAAVYQRAQRVEPMRGVAAMWSALLAEIAGEAAEDNVIQLAREAR